MARIPASLHQHINPAATIHEQLVHIWQLIRNLMSLHGTGQMSRAHHMELSGLCQVVERLRAELQGRPAHSGDHSEVESVCSDLEDHHDTYGYLLPPRQGRGSPGGNYNQRGNFGQRGNFAQRGNFNHRGGYNQRGGNYGPRGGGMPQNRPYNNGNQVYGSRQSYQEDNRSCAVM